MKYKRLLFTTKNGTPVRFHFESYFQGCTCYGGNCDCTPKTWCFALCIAYKPDEPRGGYKFIKNYFGIII